MAKAFSKGDHVKWNWGNGEGEAEVAEVHTERVERQIDGKKQTRNGTDDNPAYVLKQDDGQRVLKLHSELKSA
ncbi:DUF2945 domain-containing protein [Actinomycetospora termitidis]|uniref:DUF2945 domain-containing protein n=1 Tax=Actinomycetospora termitidis TaxID=3053470 RepID=A0ABT7M3T9_9PSEU|nr:DUF2945 domain-containing protein [Actinomycetospora sp. Odt1-22]MDL5155096.1 DUF2945 domain-containing protein [Actinomycetospora sp. Odt1-22]